ncbi:MAG: hypothetical protein GC179_18075 [Anaerolineaceae bacterium]|nr:hypothetical protein [Anaerolineaceae bacterium]
MEIPLFPTDQIPRPADEIKIEQIEITPYPDRFRVHTRVRVTPFLERPNLLMVARNQDNVIVSELNIIETMHADMEFTLHIRNVKDPAGEYTLTVELFYQTRTPPQDRKTQTFTIPEANMSTSN